MMSIQVKSNLPNAELAKTGVTNWPIWQKEASSFNWFYDVTETCYLLEGEVEVITDKGESVLIKAGDLVVFPEGLHCKWHIKTAVRKHYKFG